jgi:hypothetical protein
LRHDDAGNLLLAVGVLNVGAVENGFRADGIAHGGHIAGDGAVAHGDEELGVGANLLDLLFVVDRSDGSLDERDVDFVGKLLGVDDGAVDDVDEFGDIEEPLVHVEDRHVTAGTSIEPDCCQFQFAHCASLIRFR